MWRKSRSAPESSIKEPLQKSNLDLPVSYLDFLRKTNGATVDLDEMDFYFEISSSEEVLLDNEKTQIREFLPIFFISGDDKANELLTFKTNDPDKWAVFMTPLIGMSEEASIKLADNFDEFLLKYKYA